MSNNNNIKKSGKYVLKKLIILGTIFVTKLVRIIINATK